MNPFLQYVMQMIQQQPQPAAPSAAEYYGPADQRAQYFANMGLDVNGQRPTPVQPVQEQTPAPSGTVQAGGFGSQPNFNPYGNPSPEATFSPFAGPQMSQPMRRSQFGRFGGAHSWTRRQPTESLQMAQPSFGSQPAFGSARR